MGYDQIRKLAAGSYGTEALFDPASRETAIFLVPVSVPYTIANGRMFEHIHKTQPVDYVFAVSERSTSQH